MLFVAAVTLALWQIWRRDDATGLLVGTLLVAAAFFVLPTRVHERYLFPALALAAPLVARASAVHAAAGRARGSWSGGVRGDRLRHPRAPEGRRHLRGMGGRRPLPGACRAGRLAARAVPLGGAVRPAEPFGHGQRGVGLHARLELRRGRGHEPRLRRRTDDTADRHRRRPVQRRRCLRLLDAGRHRLRLARLAHTAPRGERRARLDRCCGGHHATRSLRGTSAGAGGARPAAHRGTATGRGAASVAVARSVPARAGAAPGSAGRRPAARLRPLRPALPAVARRRAAGLPLRRDLPRPLGDGVARRLERGLDRGHLRVDPPDARQVPHRRRHGPLGSEQGARHDGARCAEPRARRGAAACLAVP